MTDRLAELLGGKIQTQSSVRASLQNWMYIEKSNGRAQYYAVCEWGNSSLFLTYWLLFRMCLSVQSNSGEEQDCENPKSSTGKDDGEALQRYQLEINALFQDIDGLRRAIKDVEAKYSQCLSTSPNVSERLAEGNQVDALLKENDRVSDNIRMKLRQIATENKKFAADFPHKTGELKVRINLHQGAARKFMDVMKMFEKTQEKHRDNVRSTMEKKLRCMNPSVTDDDIRQAVKYGHANIIAEDRKAMSQLSPEERRKLQNELDDLRSRNNDVKKLEESIIQLHQMFMDMQVLVDAQGELLNNIEYNVEETKEATAAAHQELVIAHDYQKNAGKKKCIIICLIVAILAVIFVPVLVVYIPRWIPESKKIIDSIPVIASPSPSPAIASAGRSASNLTTHDAALNSTSRLGTRTAMISGRLRNDS